MECLDSDVSWFVTIHPFAHWVPATPKPVHHLNSVESTPSYSFLIWDKSNVTLHLNRRVRVLTCFFRSLPVKKAFTHSSQENCLCSVCLFNMSIKGPLNENSSPQCVFLMWTQLMCNAFIFDLRESRLQPRLVWKKDGIVVSVNQSSHCCPPGGLHHAAKISNKGRYSCPSGLCLLAKLSQSICIFWQ